MFALSLVFCSVPQVFLWLNLAQMSLMEEMGVTPSAYGAEKALFLCSVAHTDVQPCFSFLIVRLLAQLYTGLILGLLAPMVSTHCRTDLLTREMFLQKTSEIFSRVTVWLFSCFLAFCSCLGAGALPCIGRCSTSTINLPVNLSYFCTLPPHCPILGLHRLCHCRVIPIPEPLLS